MVNQSKPYKQYIIDLTMLLILCICVWSIYYMANFRGLIYPDAQCYVTIARNIVTGKGYISNLINADEFHYLQTNIFVPHINPLLFPYLLAGAFKVAGISDKTSVFMSGIFFLISILPLYMICNKLFGRIAAVISSMVYIFEPTLLGLGISGLSEPVFIFFLLFSFLFFVSFLEKMKISHIFLAGIFIGLAKLVRFNGLVFIIAILLALIVFIKEKRIKTILIFLMGVAFVHTLDFFKLLILKTPSVSIGILAYAAADGTTQYPLGIITRLLNGPASLQYISTYPKDFLDKYFAFVFFYFRNFFLMANPFILSFFVTHFFLNKAKRSIRIILFVILLSILLQIILISYAVAIIRYFFIFIPFIIIFGVGFLFDNFYFNKRKYSKVFLILVVLLFLLPRENLYRTILWNYGLIFKHYEPLEAKMVKQQKAIGNFIKKNTSKDDFIATDDQSLAWYADRKTLNLPLTFDILRTIDKKYKKVDAILLTQNSSIKDNSKLTGIAKELVGWSKIFNSSPKNVAEYVLVKKDEIEGNKYVFYRKKSRHKK